MQMLLKVAEVVGVSGYGLPATPKYLSQLQLVLGSVLSGEVSSSLPLSSPERVSGLGPPSSRHRSSNTKVSVAGSTSILVVTLESPGAACAERKEGSCSGGR